MLTIYKASAGSGKTYNLALTYIRHLLGYRNRTDVKLRAADGRAVRNHRSIMAITFTNAATGEMKSRIIKRLYELATAPKSSDYREELEKTFGNNLDRIQAAAAAALSELLYDYSNFYVSTIDSFFQTVLRTFAREVDQQGDYDLSLNQEDIIPEVISLMLEELNRNPGYSKSPLYGWILKQAMEMERKGDAPGFFNREGSLVGALANNIHRALDEVYHSENEKLEKYFAQPERLQAFIDQLNNRLTNFDEDIKTLAGEIKSILDTYPKFEPNSVLARIAKTAALNPRSIDPDDIREKAVSSNLIASDEPWELIAKNKTTKKELPADVLKSLGVKFQKLVSDLDKVMEDYMLYPRLLDGALELQFISLFRKSLENYLRENNTLLIADTGELISRIISDQEMPFIYERLGMTLSSLLIDEFQDTSKLQWKNLKPLVTNSVAQGNESLIIGDVKQSIYRFRNSDSSLLDHVVQTDSDFTGRIEMRGNKPDENTNHRSADDIIRFNNVLFRTINPPSADEEGLPEDKKKGYPGYEAVVQELPRHSKNLPARILLRVSLKNEKDVKVNAAKYKAWQLESLAQAIKDQHSRGYRWRDIAILVNAHKQAKEIVTYLLTSHPDIKILSNEALLLSNSPAVRTVMSILSLIHQDLRDNPRKEAEEVLESAEDEHVKIHSKADLTSLLTQFNYFRSQNLSPQDSLQNALDALGAAEKSGIKEKIRQIRDRNTPTLVALIETVIAQEVSEADRREQNAFLAALQDRAIAHCNSADPSLAAFIRAYEQNVNKWAIKAPSTLDAVQVMTIHASKGLEWPCVHLPFANWSMFKSEKMWFRLPDGLPADKALGLAAFDKEIVPPIIRLNLTSSGIFYQSDNFRRQAEDSKAAGEADSLNKLYVALTRAGRELYVHFQDNKKYTGTTYEKVLAALHELDGANQTDPRLLSFKLNTIPATDEHNALLELDYWTGGSPFLFEPDEKNSNEINIEMPYIVEERDDLDKIIAIEDLFDSADPEIGTEKKKQIVDKPLPYSAERARAAGRGLHLHTVLADMELRDDLNRSLMRLKARHQLSDSVIEEYRKILVEAFNKKPETAEWFDPQNTVWNEQNIYDPKAEKEQEEIKRPDRIIRRPDGRIVLVDYKFTYAIEDEHKTQVKEYMELLKAMGFDDVKGYLWYPRKAEIIEVTK